MLIAFVFMAYAGGTYWDRVHPLGPYEMLHVPSSWGDFMGHVLAGLKFAGWLFSILAAHEMGHYIACRVYRIHATWPYFLPAPLFMFGTFGAVIRIHGRIPDRRALFDIALAGPLAGFVVAIAARIAGVLEAGSIPADLVSGPVTVYSPPPVARWVTHLLRPGEMLQMNGTLAAAWGGFLITVLNLFPVGQLDGGHIAYAVSRRLHRWTSYLSIAAAAGVVVWAFVASQPPMYLLWVAILCWLRDRHPPLLVEYVPLGRTRSLLAIAALLLFALCFTWFPVRVLR